LNVRLTGTAKAHYLEAVRWYRERSLVGADRFRHQVREAIDRLREYPEGGPEVVAGLRRMRALGTPYSLFYVVETDAVVVLGILHGRQSPAEWRRLI
jgi:plasmid stabilization system protein ParE